LGISDLKPVAYKHFN